MDRKQYHREYMRRRRAGKDTVQDNGFSHLIDELDWKPIPECPGYEASSCGQIKSCSRKLVRRNGREHTTPDRVLRQNPDSRGYPQFRAYVDKKKKMILVHRAVYLAHIGPIPKGMLVDHIDGTRTNTKASNLQLLTPSENNAKGYEDAYKRGFEEGYDAAYDIGFADGHAIALGD